MTKYILASAAAGLVVAFVGALLHDFMRMQDFGENVIIAGVLYAVISLSLLAIPIYKRLATSSRYSELLRLKNLLDKNIISQGEFDSKSRELKAKIL